MNELNQETQDTPQDPTSFKDFASIYHEAQQAKNEAHGIKPDRFKARKLLEGMRASPKLEPKIEALLNLLDKETPPPVRTFLGIRLERRRTMEASRDAIERILWAIIGELALEITDFHCDQQAAEIQAEFLKDAQRLQRRYAEFRSFFLEHFERHIKVNETTDRDLFALAMEIMLSQKGG